jgi:hypothetical protein
MIRAGVSQQVAKAISGHKSDSMFHCYNVTPAEDLREAWARRTEYDRARLAESNLRGVPSCRMTGMYTNYYIQDGYIYGPKESGRFYVQDGYIYGPRNGGRYYIQDNYIYGPKQSGRLYIETGYIYGPSKELPWMADE